MTTCLDIGTWRSINVTCIPIELPLLPVSGLRNGQGRALTYDLAQPSPTEPQETQGLVVALAVVAGLLTAAMLVVGTLLARRHLLSGPGSLRSLVRSTPTKDPTFYGAMVSPQHQDISTTVSHSSVLNSNDGPVGGNATSVEPSFRSSLYQQNILANLPIRPDDHSIGSCHVTSITESELDDDPNYAHINGHEPPYEQVRSRSEHSYETLRKKSIISETDSESGSVRELDDKDSVGYESVKEGKGKDPGYEIVKEKDHDYETLKEKEPGYEMVEDTPDHGYETVREPLAHHGYETLKPKPPPPRIGLQSAAPLDEESVPDILQNLAGDDPLPEVPPEILALYARIDKSKKRRYADATNDSDSTQGSETCSPTPPPPPHSPVSPNISSNSSSTSISDPPTDISFISEGPPGTYIAKDLIRKFNRLLSEDEMSPQPRSRQGSIASDTGSLRPLPPLPREVNSMTPPC